MLRSFVALAVSWLIVLLLADVSLATREELRYKVFSSEYIFQIMPIGDYKHNILYNGKVIYTDEENYTISVAFFAPSLHCCDLIVTEESFGGSHSGVFYRTFTIKGDGSVTVSKEFGNGVIPQISLDPRGGQVRFFFRIPPGESGGAFKTLTPNDPRNDRVQVWVWDKGTLRREK